MVVERPPSWSACFTSILRAAHQVLDEEPKLLNDPFVVGLVDGSSVDEIQQLVTNYNLPIMQLTRFSFILRNRIVEDMLKVKLNAPLEQFVILGAGLDTFAYRQPYWAKHLKIIEIDHPNSQEFKKNHLRKANITVPKNVTFYPIDFELASLKDALTAVYFNANTRSYFSWIGVTQYLTMPAILSTVKTILSLPEGSGIIFSFILPEHLLEGIDKQASVYFSEMLASKGEPWLTRLDPVELQELLYNLGFKKVMYFKPEMVQKQYLHQRSDQRIAPIYEQLMYAEV